MKKRRADESWRRARTVVPAISALRRRADEVRRGGLDKHAAELARLGSTERQLVETVARELIGELLHYSTAQLRQTAIGDSSADSAIFATRQPPIVDE